VRGRLAAEDLACDAAPANVGRVEHLGRDVVRVRHRLRVARDVDGLETICRTIILGDALVMAAIEGAAATNGFVEEPTAQPLRGAPPPGSPAGADARAALAAEDDEVVPEATIVQPSDGREGGF
jgi:hypothetical protein